MKIFVEIFFKNIFNFFGNFLLKCFVFAYFAFGKIILAGGKII